MKPETTNTDKSVSDTVVDIGGLDKVDVLMALIRNGRPQGLSLLQPKVSRDGLQAVLRRNSYVDYCNGVPIKTNFETDQLDLFLYDRDCGVGQGKRVVEELRKDLNK